MEGSILDLFEAISALTLRPCRETCAGNYRLNAWLVWGRARVRLCPVFYVLCA